jgi:glycosyltransferase involved in cell wall biosynthesis
MISDNQGGRPAVRHLAWIYTEPILETLDAATWLRTSEAMRRAGWKVTLAAPGLGGRQLISGVEVRCLARPDVYLLRQFIFHFKALLLLLHQWRRTDVILFHPMSTLFLLPLRLVRGLTSSARPLFVLDIRTVQMESRETETSRVRIRESFQRLSRRVADKWADGQTAITVRMAEAVSIPAEKLLGVWPSGVDPSHFRCARESRAWPAKDEPVRLLYLGSLHHERNLMTLSRAVFQANMEGLSFHLTLIGEGSERRELERFAARAGGMIQVLPPVPHEEVGEALGKAHLGVSPFPDEEKFRVSSPIKLFEYLASGLPILATRIACHTDVVADGSFVVWAGTGDEEGLLQSLRLAWKTRDRLPTMGREAAAAAELWTWERSAAKLEAALERGLGAARGEGRQRA